MGQGQSQEAKAPMSEWDPSITPEERAQAQADLREKQQAALDKRLVTKKKIATKNATQTGDGVVIARETAQEDEAPAIPELRPARGPEAEAEAKTEQDSEELTQTDLRAKQQAALDKRFATKQKRPTASTSASAQGKKKPSALEEASKENVGYRNMDSQAQFRSWN